MAEDTTAPKSATPRKRAAPKAQPVVASGQGHGANATNRSAQGLVGRAKETTSKLASEAKTAARNAANEGKDKASEALAGVSRAVESAASLVEEKVGPAYGNYARKAADQVSDIATSLQSKDIDDLIEDARTFVRKQPMIAIGAAAAVGFILTRLVKIGANTTDDDRTA